MARIAKDQLDTTLVDTTGTQTVSGKNLSSGNTFPTFNQNTTGTASNVTGTVAIANGGTGSTSQNFVDLTTLQASIGGAKTWTGAATFSSSLTANGASSINGAVTYAAASITTSTTLTTASTQYQVVNSASAVTVTLPSTTTAGLTFTIKNIGAGIVSVAATTFDGSASPATIPQYCVIEFQSTSTSGVWLAINIYTPNYVQTNTIQTITNKTVGDALSFTGQSSTPATPATTAGKFYVNGTSAGRPAYINSTGIVETLITAKSTNSITENGWGYITVSTSSATLNTTVTFPSAFTAAPNVLLTILGYSLSVPTSVTNFTGVYSNNPTSHITSTTTTNFVVNIQGSAVFGAVAYIGFTWVAFGT